MRARCAVGEVDIVARRGRMLAFVEVKARRNFDEAGFALEGIRLKRVAAAAEWLFHRMARPGEDMRIDAILIAPLKFPRLLVDIWRG